MGIGIEQVPREQFRLAEKDEGFFWASPESIGSTQEEMAAGRLGPERRAEIEKALLEAVDKLRALPTHCAEKYDGTPLVN